MPRYHNINGQSVQFTADEETARDAEEAAWAAGADTRAATSAREERDKLLAETDWMANSDVTMSDAWRTYRQSLRDITSHSNWPNLNGGDWPTEPS
tara:strand:- start:3 stop:290 length:288 start_codon:yes stop_codon:yes gene_type:complete